MRPLVEALRHFPASCAAEALRQLRASCAAEALRQLRASDEPPIEGVEGVGVLKWTIGGLPAGHALYHAVEGPAGPLCVVRYNLRGVEMTDALGLVEVPSNLGKGQLVYLRCHCGQLARVVYLAPDGRFRCRRCCPVVYQSSRDSDRRVSNLLAGHRWPVEPPGDLRRHDAQALARFAGRDLITLLKAAERLTSVHRGAGRPWSHARRAAYERNRE